MLIEGHHTILLIVFFIMISSRIYGYQLSNRLIKFSSTTPFPMKMIVVRKFTSSQPYRLPLFKLYSTAKPNLEDTKATKDTKENKKLSKKSSSAVLATTATVTATAESTEPLTQQGIEEIKQARLEKIQNMKESGMNPFAYNYPVTYASQTLQEKYKNLENGVEIDTIVSVAGRITARRVFGKLAFFTLLDDSGTIQLYLEKSRLLNDYDKIKEWTDSGDIIGVTGTIKRTEKGELSVVANSWAMLTKSLLPLPDKYHGLTDINKRYRQRHLDMIVNTDVRKTLRSRAFIISNIRQLLDQKGFVEIETPILNNQPGGAEAKPFETYHNSLDMHLTLRIATELHLKRLVVGGIEKVYEIGRIFRNEGISTRHNPEFTSIELYQAYADYHDMMTLTEELVSNTAIQLLGNTIVQYQGREINLSPPWRRITMIDIVKETTGIDFTDFIENQDYIGAKTMVENSNIISKTMIYSVTTAGELLNIVFEEKCEATLDQPTFITEHPVEISPLAKPHRSKKNVVERFEMFMVGREHANAFSELTDPIDQRQRFVKQAEKKAAGDEEACDVDEDFLSALETGMPPTAGLGIGIDRLVMVLTDAPSIRDVIAFPLLKKES